MSEDHLEPMYGDSTMPAMNKLGEFELSPAPKWRLRMAGIALLGTSIGMQKAYMGVSGYSVQHVLYAIAGIMVFSGFIFGRFPRLNARHNFIVGWWFFAMLVSTWFSPFREAILPFVSKGYLYLTVSIICGMAIASSQDSLRKFTYLMILTAVGSCIVAAIQTTTGAMYFLASDEFGVEYGREVAAGIGRAYGFFANPNNLANWLFIPIGVSIARLTYPPPQGSGKLTLIVLPVLLGGMILSISRSGIAATVLIFLMVLGVRGLKVRTLGLIFITMILVAAGSLLLAPEATEIIALRLAEFSLDEGRAGLIRIALDNIGNRFFVGTGPFGFWSLSDGKSAHNGLLEPLVELGIIGWFPIMLGIAGGLVCFWKCARLRRGTNTEWLWRGWAAGATGMVMSQMIHGSGWRDVFLWAVLSIGSVGFVTVREQMSYEQYYLDDEYSLE